MRPGVMFESVWDRIVEASEKLPVCPECGPVRGDVKRKGVAISVRVLCFHQKAEKEARDAAEDAIKWKQARVERALEGYRRYAPPPGQYAALALADLDGRLCSRDGVSAARRYVDTWSERRREGQGIAAVGDIGTGKTMVLVAASNEIVRTGASVRFLTVTDLQAKLKNWDEAQRSMEDLKRVDLLLLDDFGQERVTEWSGSMLFDLVDARYQNKLPTCITTNLGADQMREHYIRSLTQGKNAMPADQAAVTVDRVLSRLRQRNASVVFTGEDQRRLSDHNWLTSERNDDD